MSLKKAYLYLVSVISLVIWVVGAIMLVDMGLKAWIFTKADRYAYYPACVETTDVSGTVKSPECDPAYQEKQAKSEEENRTAQRQRDAAQSIAMIIIAAPIWWYHWRQARKEQ